MFAAKKRRSHMFLLTSLSKGKSTFMQHGDEQSTCVTSRKSVVRRTMGVNVRVAQNEIGKVTFAVAWVGMS